MVAEETKETGTKTDISQIVAQTISQMIQQQAGPQPANPGPTPVGQPGVTQPWYPPQPQLAYQPQWIPGHPRGGVCFNCRTPGHYSRECPYPLTPQQCQWNSTRGPYGKERGGNRPQQYEHQHTHTHASATRIQPTAVPGNDWEHHPLAIKMPTTHGRRRKQQLPDGSHVTLESAIIP